VVRGDDFHHPLQVIATEAFFGKYLSDFLSLALWNFSDLTSFLMTDALPLLFLGPGAQEVADAHAESIGYQVSYTQDNHYARRQACPGHSRHYGKGGDSAVNGPKDKVAQVTMVWPSL
jgi:hypothetical protein